MRSRKIVLTSDEQEEQRLLIDSGVLNDVLDEHEVTSYLDAYLIYKGKKNKTLEGYL